MGSKPSLKICLYTAFLIIALLGAVIPDIWAAENPIGKIVALRGRATAFQDGGAPRVLALKSPVYLKETIATAKGRLQIMFTDNTLITIGHNAKMVLDAYMWKEGDPESTLHTRIKAGSFRVMGGAITRDAPQNFKTQAPSATIGIRGSMYAGLVQGNRLSVVYQGGKGIYVSNQRGRVEIDRPGFGTQVADMGQPPDPPEKVDEARLDEIEGGMAVGGGGEDDEDTGDIGGGLGISDGGSDADTADQAETPLLAPDTVTEALADSSVKTNTQARVPVAANSREQSVFDLLAEIGFKGGRSTSLPSSGIWIYTGVLRDEDPAYPDEVVKAHINWHNRRFLGFEKDPNYFQTPGNGFAIGEVTETGVIQNVRLFGSGNSNGNTHIYALTGSETFGQVYGISQGAIGLTMKGIDYPLHQPFPTPPDGPLQPQEWSDTLAAIWGKVSNSPDPGKAWNGFFMGLGEDMNNIDTGRVCFMNNDASDFTIAFNRDTGTFSGIMTGTDTLGSATHLNALQIGGAGATQSAYIADDLLGGELSGVISNGSGSTALKPYGNFMVSSMDAGLSANTYWGYWEVAYNEPGTGHDFHVHVPGAFWIAGVRTPGAQVQSLIDTQPAGTLAYTGGAMGIMIEPTVSPGQKQVRELTNGSTALNVDFSSRHITGKINFSEVNLGVAVSAADFLTHGFSGFITTSGATTDSKIFGAFFGPNAEGLGGNFTAEISGRQYKGIFAGDR